MHRRCRRVCAASFVVLLAAAGTACGATTDGAEQHATAGDSQTELPFNLHETVASLVTNTGGDVLVVESGFNSGPQRVLLLENGEDSPVEFRARIKIGDRGFLRDGTLIYEGENGVAKVSADSTEPEKLITLASDDEDVEQIELDDSGNVYALVENDSTSPYRYRLMLRESGADEAVELPLGELSGSVESFTVDGKGNSYLVVQNSKTGTDKLLVYEPNAAAAKEIGLADATISIKLIDVDDEGNLYALFSSRENNKAGWRARKVAPDGTRTEFPLGNVDVSSATQLVAREGYVLLFLYSPTKTVRIKEGAGTPEVFDAPQEFTAAKVYSTTPRVLDDGMAFLSPSNYILVFNDDFSLREKLPFTATRGDHHFEAGPDSSFFVTDNSRVFRVVKGSDSGGKDDSAGQTLLPFQLTSTVSGMAVDDEDAVVVSALDEDGHISYGRTYDLTSDEPGTIVRLEKGADQPTAVAASTPSPTTITAQGANIFAAEVTSGEGPTGSSFDDTHAFQVRIFGGTDPNGRVVPLDVLATTRDDKLSALTAIAVTPSGDVYACASSTFGDALLKFPAAGGAGESIAATAGSESCRNGLARNSKGDVLALGERVLVRLPGGDGDPVGVWMPEVLRPVAMTVGPDDSIYVLDNGGANSGQRVVRFTEGSKDVESIVFAGTVGGFHSIAVGNDGAVFVSDDNLVYRLAK